MRRPLQRPRTPTTTVPRDFDIISDVANEVNYSRIGIFDITADASPKTHEGHFDLLRVVATHLIF